MSSPQSNGKKDKSFWGSVLYTIHGKPLNTVLSTKYLGLTIDTKLNYNEHVSNICRKANSTRAFIHRNNRSSPRRVKATAYTSFVRPQLEYAAIDPEIDRIRLWTVLRQIWISLVLSSNCDIKPMLHWVWLIILAFIRTNWNKAFPVMERWKKIRLNVWHFITFWSPLKIVPVCEIWHSYH